MLRIDGKKTVEKPPEEVWRMLTDPAALRQTIPGCEELVPTGLNKFRIALRLGVGFVKGRFAGEAELKDIEEGRNYTLEVHAKGTLGFIEGKTHVRLERIGERRTEVHYESEGHVGGIVASVGSRFFEEIARTFTEEFFERLARE
jgi:carbon monoxide dehydrogenase subunit G